MIAKTKDKAIVSCRLTPFILDLGLWNHPMSFHQPILCRLLSRQFRNSLMSGRFGSLRQD
ncbi:MAG: hypothetical protein EBS79_04685 [Gammaproteobacteria bacterium]|nr:hypothetical protein [Gammaproteobacteria bacterium]NDE34166.1 hypothetical protein [Gammaproteobacteria bacterium]NDE56143.1 hypothetical protein [Gammaproteobacteria bacterium]